MYFVCPTITRQHGLSYSTPWYEICSQSEWAGTGHGVPGAGPGVFSNAESNSGAGEGEGRGGTWSQPEQSGASPFPLHISSLTVS